MNMLVKQRKVRALLALAAIAVAATVPSAMSLADTEAGAVPDRFKAIVYHEYGSPEVIKLEEVAQPALEDHQVLIKVHAAAANPLDWHYLRGIPYVMRFQTGLRAPENIRLGADVAGVVVAVGRTVTTFKPGDEVYGVAGGAYAEYARANHARIALKPPSLTFAEAAAIPVAGITALQALRDTANVQAGQAVLINGASGGVGTFAVQIAKAMNANVTGVCSTRNVELVSSLGADRVIDYTKEDFTQRNDMYDVVLDNVGNHSLSDVRRVTNRTGTHVLNGGGSPSDDPWIGPLGPMIASYIQSPFVEPKAQTMLASVTTEDLNLLSKWVEENKVRPVIDRSYPLAETAAAIAYIEEGRARGKVVITVVDEPIAPEPAVQE